ncbi:MAG: ATP-binding cassette domain-containing protein [Bacteroidia bacterium]|nr:ATP-binding cassette domain-containing protein [Bacteroidia bacterium]
MVVKTNNLKKVYGRIKAVDDLSIEIEKGSVHGILGPNGSGKTTLLGILLNVIRATSGTYSWFDGADLSLAHKRIGALLEYPNFYHYMSGYDNLAICADIKQKGKENIQAVLDQVGLRGRQKDKFKTYSLGMKQRLAIASCLLADPEVLVLDEPTNGLDPQGISEVRNIIKNIAAKGTTIIIASHLLDEVEKVCSDVTILKEGQNIYTGKVSGLGSSKNVFEISSEDMSLLETVVRQIQQVRSSKRDGEYLILECEQSYTTGNLNKDLGAQNIYLTHLEVRRDTLERNFMELLKGKA